MGEGSPRGHIGLAALDCSQDVEMVQHVVHAAIIGEPVEKSPHGFFSFHISPRFAVSHALQL